MDTTPIYELRARLRAAGIAGTSLLSEDFRLKRAYEAFKPLEAASPVFAKLGQLTTQLLAPDCPNLQNALLDTITLADAVICTLGTVDIKGEVADLDIVDTERNTGSIIVNAPYSTLKELLEALTTSGSGHYAYVCDVRENRPELFRDYRVRYALVQALGAPYAELANEVKQWMKEDQDKTILPLLYKDFDPQGKKDMVRRVMVIDAIAGAEANDFYLEMLKGAQKDIRLALLNALRHNSDNVTLLLDLAKKEKGKNKDKVLELLAEMEEAKACDFYQEMMKKKPENALQNLKNTTTEWSAELVAAQCNEMLVQIDALDKTTSDEKKFEVSERLQKVIRALFGKGGTIICECYRSLLARKDKINPLFRETWKVDKKNNYTDILRYGVLDITEESFSSSFAASARKIEIALGKILHHSLLVNPDTALQELALELYTGNVNFLPAAVTAKLIRNEECTQWLIMSVPEQSKEHMNAVLEAAIYIEWDQKQKGYQFAGNYIDTYADSYEYEHYNPLKTVEVPIPLTHAKEIMDWLKRYGTKAADDILGKWVALNDKEQCQEMGEYFYKRALVSPDNHSDIYYMKKCGWTVCKGLGVKYIKNNPNVTAWSLYYWLSDLSEDKAAVMEEAKAICDKIKSGEIKMKSSKLQDFEKYMDNWYERS